MQNKGRNHTWRVLGILSLTLGIGLVLSAWSWQIPDTADTSATEQDPVMVTVAEDSLTLSTTTLSSGSHSFEVTNEGRGAHSFALTGPVEKSLKGEVAAGKTKTLEASLKPGTYTAYCPVEGHRETESVEFTVGQ